MMESAFQFGQSGSKVCTNSSFPHPHASPHFLPLLLWFWRYYVSFTCLLSPLWSHELYKGRDLPALFTVTPSPGWCPTWRRYSAIACWMKECFSHTAPPVSPPMLSSNLLLHMSKHITMKMRPPHGEGALLHWLGAGAMAWRWAEQRSTRLERSLSGAGCQQIGTQEQPNTAHRHLHQRNPGTSLRVLVKGISFVSCLLLSYETIYGYSHIFQSNYRPSTIANLY